MPKSWLRDPRSGEEVARIPATRYEGVVGLLDKLGNATLEALDRAARYAERARERKLKNTKASEQPKVVAPVAAAAPPAPAPALAQEIGDKHIPVQVFGRMTCPWTVRALRLLQDRQVEHVFRELAEAGGYALAPKLAASTGQRTVPYVFVRGTFLGGFDALDELDRLGQLDEMIKSEEERAASPATQRTRIQVAPRR